MLWPTAALSLTPPRLQAILAMSNTTFIILILLVGSLLFIRDADRLVLTPLERMVKKVRAGARPFLIHRPDIGLPCCTCVSTKQTRRVLLSQSRTVQLSGRQDMKHKLRLGCACPCR